MLNLNQPETIDGAGPWGVRGADVYAAFDRAQAKVDAVPLQEYYDKQSSTELLLEERAAKWGDPVTTHARIAEVWSGILGYPVTAHDVALCMNGLKLVRAQLNPDDPDSLDDAKGYASIGQ